MKKYFIVTLLLLSLNVASQNKVSFQLESITKMKNAEEEDTTNLIKPKTLTISANPLSRVTEFIKIEEYSIGLQIEILKSKLQNTEHLILGIVFYKKKQGAEKWEFMSRNDHWPVYDSKGNLGTRGEQIASSSFRLSEGGLDFNIFYHLFVN